MVLYQTELHSDEGGRLIGEGSGLRKRVQSCVAIRAFSDVASAWGLRYPACSVAHGQPGLGLVGNGVMVTLRFLVPSF